MLQFIDTHIHLQDFKPDFAPRVIRNVAAKKLILISAEETDYEKIAALLRAHPRKLCGAFGVHPWYCKENFDEKALREKLKEFPQALIGEIGVDELRGPVTKEQHILFSKQLAIAQELHRPVVVHAAKAFMALKEHEKELKAVKYVHHGFVKNNELLKFINKTGGYIGLGALFLRQEKAREMWQNMPRGRVLFETDAPYRVDEMRYNQVVQENLRKLAEIVGEDAEKLTLQLQENAKNFMICGK